MSKAHSELLFMYVKHIVNHTYISVTNGECVVHSLMDLCVVIAVRSLFKYIHRLFCKYKNLMHLRMEKQYILYSTK